MARLEDEAAEVEIRERRVLHDGFRRLDAVRLDLGRPSVARGRLSLTREVLHVGRVAALLPYDPVRDSLVLVHQFRIGAYQACGMGELVEIVAGLVDDGEDMEGAARRETLEETGLEAGALVHALDFLPSPGVSDEIASLFCGRVDAARLPERAGEDGESEITRPFTVDAGVAVEALSRPLAIRNGYTLMALNWFALNRDRLRRAWLA